MLQLCQPCLVATHKLCWQCVCSSYSFLPLDKPVHQPLQLCRGGWGLSRGGAWGRLLCVATVGQHEVFGISQICNRCRTNPFIHG